MEGDNFKQASVTLQKGQSLVLVNDSGAPHYIANGTWKNGSPDAHILASSYPARYPLNASASRVLSRQLSLLQTALRGTPASSTFTSGQGRAIGAASPILNSEKRVLGAAYVQMSLDKPGGLILLYFAGEWLVTGLLLPILLAPLGAVFGLITTRKLVRRIHRLVAATAAMAEGDYSQRIPVSRRDEVRQLEQQFNTMAQRLDASIAAQKALTEQNTRLEERARLARDLHDSVKQQIFAISMQLGAARSLFEHKPAAARQHLLEADNLAYEARQELTSLIQEFRPLASVTKISCPPCASTSLPGVVRTPSRSTSTSRRAAPISRFSSPTPSPASFRKRSPM